MPKEPIVNVLSFDISDIISRVTSIPLVRMLKETVLMLFVMYLMLVMYASPVLSDSDYLRSVNPAFLLSKVSVVIKAKMVDIDPCVVTKVNIIPNTAYLKSWQYAVANIGPDSGNVLVKVIGTENDKIFIQHNMQYYGLSNSNKLKIGHSSVQGYDFLSNLALFLFTPLFLVYWILSFMPKIYRECRMNNDILLFILKFKPLTVVSPLMFAFAICFSLYALCFGGSNYITIIILSFFLLLYNIISQLKYIIHSVENDFLVCHIHYLLTVDDDNKEVPTYDPTDRCYINIEMLEILKEINCNRQNIIFQFLKLGQVFLRLDKWGPWEEDCSGSEPSKNMVIYNQLILLKEMGLITIFNNMIVLTINGKEVLEQPRLLFISHLPSRVAFHLSKAESAIKSGNASEAISICSTEILEGFTRAVIDKIADSREQLTVVLSKHIRRESKSIENATLGELQNILIDIIKINDVLSTEDKNKIDSVLSACKNIRNAYAHLKTSNLSFKTNKAIEDASHLANLSRIYVSLMSSRLISCLN